ncbi:MAG: PH domain-containing protein [Thermoanaerobaculia bacterium]|nr:PH domain-containing protein [Thermoanaerobaculia bacterium]
MDIDLRRLHRLSWLFLTARSAKGLVMPLLFVLFASASNPWARFELFGALFIIPALIGGIIKQRVYNYRFGEDDLVVRDGVLTRKERHIPYDRIHNIAVVRNPLHRLLGVASARIETAGGGSPEAVMSVLSMAAIGELRERALDLDESPRLSTIASDGEGTPEPTARRRTFSTLLQVPASELVRLGLTSGRGGVVLGAVAGLLFQFQGWEFDRDWGSEWKSHIPGNLSNLVPDFIARNFEKGALGGQILIGLGALLLFLIVMRVLSMFWHLVKYYGFTLLREGNDLRSEYGLLTTISSLLPVHRIQLITVRTTLLQRWLDRSTIQLESAGASDEGSELSTQVGGSGASKRRQYLAPILASSKVAPFLIHTLPEADLENVRWNSLSQQARQRILNRILRITAPLTLILAFVFGLTPLPVNPWSVLWLPAIVLPTAYIGTAGWLRFTAWGLGDQAIFYRSGWLSKSVSLVPFSKIQTVSLQESPFDRRRCMASLSVDTAGASPMGHRIAIPYLDATVANDLQRRLYAEAEATEFDW